MSNQKNEVALSDQRKTFLAKVGSDAFKRQLQLAAPKHLTPDRILRITLTACNKNPKLFDCEESTILAAMMDCTQLGLEPDGRKAYLVPYYDGKKRALICQLIVGYQGMIELAYRHPLVTGIRARAVYERDEFEYDEGLHPFLRHKPTDEMEPGALTHAYAICNIGEHGSTFVVLNRRQVMKAKASSSSADKSWSPWNEFEEAMWVKTAVRALSKYMPTSTELAEAIRVDDRHASAVIDIGAVTSMPAGNLGGGQQTITDMAAEETGTAGEGSVETSSSTTTAEKQEEKKPDHTPTPKELSKSLLAKGREINAGKGKITEALVSLKYLEAGAEIDSLDAKTLAEILDAWEQVADRIKNPDGNS